MATAVRISEELVKEARKFSRIDHRSLTGQIEHWAKIGKCAEENPDLTYSLIKEIKKIIKNPFAGEEKKGDLCGVYIISSKSKLFSISFPIERLMMG